MFSVKKYDKSISKQNLNAKKVYCVDHALVTSVTTALNEKKGYLLENMVFTHLRRKSENIYYYKTKQGNEVDFYWFNEVDEAQLIQVSWDINDEQTRKRELRSLQQAMNETGLNVATVVTANQSETMEVDAGTVELVPAWRFFIA